MATKALSAATTGMLGRMLGNPFECGNRLGGTQRPEPLATCPA